MCNVGGSTHIQKFLYLMMAFLAATELHGEAPAVGIDMMLEVGFGFEDISESLFFLHKLF